MLVITGTGRSGTTVLAALCQRLGFDPGGAYVAGINAGLEDPEVVAINEDILRPGGGERGHNQILSVRRDVIKDPRFILARGTALRTWWRERQDLRVVLTTRDPSAVVSSRQAHPHWFGPVADGTAQALEEYIAATVGLMANLGVPFCCLRFPDFLAHPGHVLTALRFGGLSFRDGRAYRHWRRLVDFSKVRHSPPPDGGGRRRSERFPFIGWLTGSGGRRPPQSRGARL